MTEQSNPGSARPSRREFLTTTAAAGTALAAGLAHVPFVHAAGTDTIQIGLIGCGGRGSQAAENALAAAPNVKVIAIGDVFNFRIKDCKRSLTNFAEKDEVCKKHGNSVDLPDERCYVGLDAYEKVINTPGVNYVILATPPGFRPMCLQAAVAAGKNIFTEKPVGVDGPGIRKVLAAYEDAQKKGLCIAAGTQRRHQLGYLETMKQVHDGAIGDINALRCYWNNQGIWFHPRKDLADKGEKTSDLAFQLYNWYHFVWTCGDHIVEQHVHNLDVCNWAMKTHPIKATGGGGRHCRPAGDPQEVGHIFDSFSIDFEYPGGIHMFSMCQHLPSCENNVSEALVGTKGKCQVDKYTINGKRVVSKELTDAAPNPYVQEHTDLIESIRSGKPINELKNVAESTLTAILGRMSTYCGRTVTWDQALNSKHDTMPEQLSWDMKIDVAPVAIPGKTKLELVEAHRRLRLGNALLSRKRRRWETKGKPMDLSESVLELQKVAEFRRAKRILRAAGTGGIIFGLLALVGGVLMLAQNPINLILILLGLVLLGEGIWNVALPTAEGVIVDGIALILVGLWNTFVSVVNAAAGAPEGAHWGVVGLFQIGYGIYRFTMYGRFYQAFQERPPAEDVQRLDEIVKQVLRSTYKNSADIINFDTRGFFKQQKWKGQLTGAAALFVDQLGHDVLIAPQDEVEFVKKGKVLIGSTLKASFRIKDQTFNGLISPESFARYEQWKLGETEPPTVEEA